MKLTKDCCGKPEKDDGVKMPPEEEIKRQAGLLKAMSDPARIKIIYALKDGELCVCEIMALLEMPQTMVSHHCKILKFAGIATDKKSGKWVNYSLSDKRALGMLESLYPGG